MIRQPLPRYKYVIGYAVEMTGITYCKSEDVATLEAERDALAAEVAALRFDLEIEQRHVEEVRELERARCGSLHDDDMKLIGEFEAEVEALREVAEAAREEHRVPVDNGYLAHLRPYYGDERCDVCEALYRLDALRKP